MLLDEYIEVSVANNKRYYENLGYEIPTYIDKYNRVCVRKGTKIVVKVSDLPKGSDVKVKAKCDCCGVEKYVIYSQ